MEVTDTEPILLFSDKDVLDLFQFRIQFNHMFTGKRGSAKKGWKMVTKKLGNKYDERRVAQKFSNLVNMHNGKLKWRGCRIVGSENVSEQDNAMVHIDKSSSVISNEEFEYYNLAALVKDDPKHEISWPLYNLTKEAIIMLKKLNTKSQIDFENYEDKTFDDGTDKSDDQIADEDQDENQQPDQSTNGTDDENKHQTEGIDSVESDSQTSPNTQFQKNWHRDLVMKLIDLRGVKYAKYFESKDKNTNNQGWLKILAEMDVKGLGEKQLRKKWQNMVHRYKCINDTIGPQSPEGISWQFYQPMSEILTKDKSKYSLCRPLSRKSSNSLLNSTSNNDQSQSASTSNNPSPASSPLSDHARDIPTDDDILEPIVTITVANEMLNQTTQRVTRGAYVKGKYARLLTNGLPDSDDDHVKCPPKKAKIQMVKMEHEFPADFGNGTNGHQSTSLLEYERERDRILFAQNNNMLKMMKSMLEKQGVCVPYEVVVDYSHI